METRMKWATGLMGVCLLLTFGGCSADGEQIYTGTLEAEEYTISSAVGGEILTLTVEKGDRVKKGDLLAQIDTSVMALEMNRLEANARAINAQLSMLLKGARSEEIKQINLQIEQQSAAIATLSQQYAFVSDQYDDVSFLHESGAVSDQALRETEMSKNSVSHALEQAIDQKSVLIQKQELLLNGATQEEIEILQHQLEAANWAIESIKRQMADAEIVATVDGYIEWVQYNPQEIYRPLSSMMTILKEGPLWAKIFVEEENLYQVNLGDQLDVLIPHLESPIKGEIVYIASKGEFTPKNTESKDIRQSVVYEVNIQLDTDEQQLKPGMLIDVRLNGVDHEK